MSRKHFVELAKVVRELKGKADEPSRRMVAEDLARLCAQSSSRFDRGRFMDACELEGE